MPVTPGQPAHSHAHLHATCPALAGRTVEAVHADLQHLMEQYGSSPALLRIDGRPVYYMYDSYRIPADAWAKLLTPGGELTVRGTHLDGEDHLTDSKTAKHACQPGLLCSA